ncbi:MAG: hypothetical protein M9921_05960 [Fimbriimonadaceae bacterium]|nr:hypothetical protein [Chthonomonadaceae bacterium]MCO5296385.1 hypothetical protein [Fimbriimonadaceae bacterium]
MKPILRLAALAAALLSVATSFAQSKNPTELLQSINQFRTQRLTEMRNSGGTIDVNALNADVAAKAAEAIQGVDPTKVEAAQAYAWAQLFSLAGKHQETCDLAAKFLTTKPDPDQRYAAQMLMLSSCNTLGEGEKIAQTLPGVAAPNLAATQAFLRTVVGVFSDTIAEDLGPDAAMKAIDAALAQVQFETPEAYADRMFASTKARNLKNRDGSAMTDDQIRTTLVATGKSVNDSLGYSVVDKKSELLLQAGRKDDAVKLLEDYVAKTDPASAYARRASSTLKQMTLVGSAAVELNYDRKHGDYPGLDKWKGKVVIIDFTAHW